MTARPPTTPDRCLSPDERAAFALGETDAAARAAVSRHVLRCPACRTALDAEERVVGRLRAFAAAPTWESDLAAADLALAARARRRRRAALAGVAAAAALVLAWNLGVRPVGAPRGDGAVPAATAAAPEATAGPAPSDPAAGPLAPHEVAALVAAQARDGRWRATTGSARHDVGATGLAVLALLRGHASVPDGAAARAVADAVRWLAPRADDPRAAGDRERAVAAEALAAVHRATGDRAVGAAAERARRSTELAGAAGAPDPSRVLAYVRAAPPVAVAVAR